MNRKEFMSTTLKTGLVSSAYLFNNTFAHAQNFGDSRGMDMPREDYDRVQKAVRAMLTMQRRAWEQGTAAQALLELGETELVVLHAKDALVNQTKDGRLGLNGNKSPVADPASSGEPVLFAYEVTGDEKFKQAADRMLEFLLDKAPKTSDGIIYHNYNENKVWVDAFYMSPPFIAVAGHPEEAVKQVVGYRRILLNPEKKLYYHIWDDNLNIFSRELFWGTGNGWAAAGMTRVLKALPDSMKKEKDMIVGYIKEVIDGCLVYQRSDGLFHDILDDPSSFLETNIAQMLSYSIYRGVKAGYLDKRYLTAADRMRIAARKNVDEFGIVQHVCGAPNFNRSGTSVEGQSFFILMEAAYRDMNA